MGAVEEIREGKPLFLFAFKEKVTAEEKDILTSKIKSLGGIPKLDEVLYVTDSTHVLVPPRTDNQWCPKILGAINSQKHIVTTDFIHKSHEVRRFLRESDFVPNFIRPSIELRKRSGKLFMNQTSIVLVDNARRQAELKMFLREGGATVPNWAITDLRLKSYNETSKLQFIYTDMATYENANLQKFIAKRAGNGNPVKVLSYFMICKIVTFPQSDVATRRAYESQFDVKNKDLMDKLHPRKAFRSQFTPSIMPMTKREAKVITEITIDSDGDDDDDEVQHIPQDTLDDEIEIISVSGSLKSKRSSEAIFMPYKKPKMETAFQYTYPKSTPNPKMPPLKGEIITLDSSDEETEKPAQVQIQPKVSPAKPSVSKVQPVSPQPIKPVVPVHVIEPLEAKRTEAQNQVDTSVSSASEDEVPPSKSQPSSFMTFGTAALEANDSDDWDVALPAHNDSEDQSTDGKTNDNEDSDPDENMDEDEVEAETTEDIVKFTSEDLKKELVKEYFFRYRKHQKDQLSGMDICDEFEKSCPKFDLHKESDFYNRKKKYDFKYFDENNYPYTKTLQDDWLDVILSKDDDKEETMINLYDKLVIYRSMISSRHNLSVKVLSQVYAKILELSKKSSSPPRLTELVYHMYFDVLYAQLRLHPVNSLKRREYYKALFGSNVEEFVNKSFKRAFEKNCRISHTMIEFIVTILIKDIFQWRKHDVMKEELRKPLITAFSSNKKNEIKRLLENIKSSEKRPELQALLLTIFGICSLFLSNNDDENNCSLNSSDSIMLRLFAQKYLKHYFSHLDVNMSLKDVFVKTYLLRPSWLSTLVLVILINRGRFANESQEQNVFLDTELEKLLEGLLGATPVKKLCQTNQEVVLMFMNHLFQTTPFNLISRVIMKDKNALVNEIKLKPIKLKIVKDLDKKDWKKVPFDNGVILDKKVIHSSLGQCIDLLNRVSLNDEKDFKLTNWHFL